MQRSEIDLTHHHNPLTGQNNFDLLRLLFAGTVCLVHAHTLSGFQELSRIGDILSSEAAVKSFFVISGFLIFMSYEKSSSLASYTTKRMRRIYPAYVTVVLLCALCFASISSKSLGDYFSLPWLKYVLANLSFMNFLQQTLPGVFESNPMDAVNGALWTIKIEVMFYMTVPVLVVLFRKHSPLRVIVLLYCLSVGYSQGMTAMAERTGSGLFVILARQLPGQLSYFLAGAFLYYHLPLFKRRAPIFLSAAIAVLALNKCVALPLFEPFALGTVVIFFSLFLYVGRVGKYGDFSYGIYILHFPIIQLLLNTGRFQQNPWLFLLTVITLTLFGAVALWHLIEKKYLLRGSHYLAATACHAEHCADSILKIATVSPSGDQPIKR